MKKRNFITQKSIAERAGVSQAVVSLALNDSYDITLSDETRKRVLAVAAELGYVPQAAAKSLVKGRSNNIGLVLVRPHQQIFRDPFIPNIITGLSAVTRQKGFRLLVEHIDELDYLTTISTLLKGGEVAGIVLSTYYGLEEIVEPLIKNGYPIVLLDDAPISSFSVTIDHAAGIRAAVEHIVSLNRFPVACIPFGPLNPHIGKRIQVFCESFEALTGSTISNRYICHGDYEPETGYKAMQVLLAEKPRPQVVFGMNDMMAIGAMRAIRDQGLRIPEDIAVMGYDDMRFAPFTDPALTTVSAPEIEVGREAGRLLIDLFEGGSVSGHQIKLQPQLIVRRSTQG